MKHDFIMDNPDLQQSKPQEQSLNYVFPRQIDVEVDENMIECNLKRIAKCTCNNYSFPNSLPKFRAVFT